MHASVSEMVDEPVPTWWEQVLSIGLIVLLAQALIGPVFAPTQEETPVLRLVWLPAYAATFVLVAYRLNWMWRAWPAAIAVGLTLLLAFASKYWSIDPGVTQRRVIALTMSAVFALYLGAVFRGPHLPRLLMLSGLFMSLASLVMVFAFPSIGIHQLENAGLWRGIWYEKNQMGAIMVISAGASAACLASGDPRKGLAWVTLALTILLVLATQSKTSLLCLCLTLGVVGGFWILRKGGAAFSVAMVWAAVVVAGLGLWVWNTQSAAILESLGKDPSLTGRTLIWDALLRIANERPWTGFGYSAFWGKDSVPADWVRYETQWIVPSAHNGWIDVLIQLGLPGMILIAVLMIGTTVITLLRVGGAGVREGWWSMAFLAFLIVVSFSESMLMQHQNLPWVLFMAVMTRALLPSPRPIPARAAAPLAPTRRQAYQTGPRIAAHSAHGQLRRPPFAVR